MGMEFAPTWLPQVRPPPLLRTTTLTTALFLFRVLTINDLEHKFKVSKTICITISG